MRRFGVLWLAVTGCAASPAPSQEPQTPLSAGQQCLQDARSLPEPAASPPLRVEVSHILVRHSELDRAEGATRTPEQACLRALEALQALQGGMDWPEAAAQFSDAKSSELGRVAADELPAGFSETAFSLQLGQLSYVVESERGFHILLRTR